MAVLKAAVMAAQKDKIAAVLTAVMKAVSKA